MFRARATARPGAGIPRRALLRGAARGVAVLALVPASAAASPLTAGPRDRDRFDVSATSETHAELFQRALLPGTNGAIVSTDTVVPVREYVRLRARDLDTPLARDSLDVELAAWGDVTAGAPASEHVLDGDIQTANVLLRQGAWSVRLGRQHVAGGAARYARFDGAEAAFTLAGFDAQVYGGFTVLPRWNQLPGYHYLGAAVDSDLRVPTALPSPDRLQHFLGGGRVGYQGARAAVGISVHDQWEERGLSRLDLGADAHADLGAASASGSAVLSLDAKRFADARVWVDTSPVKPLDVSVEVLHSEPALLLSRSSVLAVFSTDGYDEVGASATLRALRALSIEGGAFAELYDSGRPGARADAAVRVFADRGGHTMVRLGYTRVQAPTNGYHSLRSSLVRRITPRVSSTVEAYGYFYDEAIRDVRTSLVYAGTVSMQPTDAVSLLLGGSLARSPYAALDAQAQVRLVVNFDLGPGKGAR